MLERFLEEIERELSRRLPDRLVQARLVEADAHLREAVQARLDLGLEREAAEVEAIAAFGDALSFAEASPADEIFPRARLRWLAAFALIFATPSSISYSPLYFIPVLLFAVTMAGFARASFLSCRPARISVVAALLFVFALPLLYGFGLGHQGFGNASRRVLFDFRGPRCLLRARG